MRKSFVVLLGVLLATTACDNSPESKVEIDARQQKQEFTFGDSAKPAPNINDDEARKKEREFFNFAPSSKKTEDSPPSCCDPASKDCPWYSACMGQ